MISKRSHRPKALYALDRDSLNVIYGPKEQEDLSQLADFYTPPQTADSLIRDPAILQEAEVIFSGWGAPLMDENFLSAAPKLKAVFYGAGSIRYFTTPAFWERDILITSAMAANAVPVAEYCVATILLSMKHFWNLSRETRQNKGWMKHGHLRKVPGNFRGKVGFISMGAIARKTIDLLRDYDLKRIVCSRSLSTEEANKLGVELASLDDIFSDCDVISLHTPSLPATRGMIEGRHFELMKSGATFINTARGDVVNEKEMIEVLSRRPDITAILDVTDPEPPLPDSPLLHLENVVLSPHIAGSLGPECQRLGWFMLEEFRRYLKGESLRYRITSKQFAKMA